VSQFYCSTSGRICKEFSQNCPVRPLHPALLWELTDLVVALMTILNIVVLLIRTSDIIVETRRYLGQEH